MRPQFVMAGAGAVLFGLVGQGYASADTLTYIDQSQVWLAAPDGTAARAVTSDGTAEQPWTSPSTDNSGRILAARGNTLVLMSPTGQVLPNGMNIAPMGPCNLSVTGPLRAKVNADGTLAAYSYICFQSYWNGSGTSYSNTVNTALALTQSFTASGNQANWPAYNWPSWFGDRLLTSDGGKLFLQPADSVPSPPNSPSFEYAFAIADDYRLSEAAIVPGGRRILIAGSRKSDDVDVLLWGTLPQGPPVRADGVTNYLDELCEVPVTGSPESPTVSRDGQRIAWSDGQGVKVMAIPTESPGQCDFADPKVVSATGLTPVFGGGTTPTADTQPPAQQTAPLTARALKASARIKRKGRTTVIRSVSSSAEAKVRMKFTTVPKTVLRKNLKVTVKKRTHRVVLVAKGPRAWKSLTVQVTASGPGLRDGVWTRTWKVA
jgi:hypothetical protein